MISESGADVFGGWTTPGAWMAVMGSLVEMTPSAAAIRFFLANLAFSRGLDAGSSTSATGAIGVGAIAELRAASASGA